LTRLIDDLSFQTVTVTNVEPDYGPVAGGTRVTLSGENLRSEQIQAAHVVIGPKHHTIDIW